MILTINEFQYRKVYEGPTNIVLPEHPFFYSYDRSDVWGLYPNFYPWFEGVERGETLASYLVIRSRPAQEDRFDLNLGAHTFERELWREKPVGHDYLRQILMRQLKLGWSSETQDFRLITEMEFNKTLEEHRNFLEHKWIHRQPLTEEEMDEQRERVKEMDLRREDKIKTNEKGNR